jgi:hypothetical protein
MCLIWNDVLSHDYGAITILAKYALPGLSHKKTAVPAKTGTAENFNMLLLP